MQLLNGAQFLNATPFASASAPVIVTFPLTRIYASL